jgi:hypothetical protein
VNGPLFVGTFFALGLGLFLLNAWYSFHPTDQEFVLAYSWRIVNGEVPYRVFLYARTPLTPYLHAPVLLLPEGWAIQAGRLVYYAELATAAALPWIWAGRRLGVRATPRALALAAAFFALAVHNYPPMPWPTVDALLFASAAVTAFLLSLDGSARRRTWLRALASALVALAVLAKQTFALLALLLVAYGAVESIRQRSLRPVLSSAVPGACIAIAVAFALAAAGALDELIHQVLEPARLRASAEVPWSGDIARGLALYLETLHPALLVGMVAAFSLSRRKSAGLLTGKAAALLVLATLIALTLWLLIDPWNTGRQLWWILVALLLGELSSRDFDDRRGALALGALLAMAWCASLSFTYLHLTPLLGLGAAGIFVERALARVAWPNMTMAATLTAAFVVGMVATLNLERPYRDLPRGELTVDLGGIYPRYGRLFTNAANADRTRELRELIEEHALAAGYEFLVMPDYPLIHYLSGTRAPLSLDWIQPQEYLGRTDRLIAELDARRPVVLIQRQPSLPVRPSSVEPSPCDDPPDRQEIVVRVATTWRVIAEGRYFCVYRAP